MKYTKFSIRIPKDICDLLDSEAFNDTRNRTQMITKILKERYHSHAPPITTKRQPTRTITARNGRKASSAN